MNFDISRVDLKYYKAYITHDFDFTTPFIFGVFRDYRCKKCDILLIEMTNKKYVLDMNLNIPSKDTFYQSSTCNEVLMESILK